MIEEVKEIYQDYANPERAVQASAYMRNQFSYLGIMTPIRKEISKEILKIAKEFSGNELVKFCDALWAMPEREYKYLAIDILKKYPKKLEPKHLDNLKKWITTESWWDTVDILASNPLGNLLDQYPELLPEMDKWIKNENLWIRRSALLYQLKYKDKTDEKRLFDYCIQQMKDPDFFIRKAIGWVLREYSKTKPEAVIDFVEDNKSVLSNLSQKEALKRI